MKKTIIGSTLIFVAAYAVTLLATFPIKKESARNDISKMLAQNAPHWHDSVINIEKTYNRSTWNSEIFNKKKEWKIITDYRKDTLKISHAIIGVTNMHLFKSQMMQTFFLDLISHGCNNGDIFLNITDSLWNRALHQAGYKGADATLMLSTKRLEDMFPHKDTLVSDCRSFFVCKRHLNGKDHFVTDSVSLGFCNQGYIVSLVHLPAATIIAKETQPLGPEIFIAIAATLIFLYVTQRKSTGKKEQKATLQPLPEQQAAPIAPEANADTPTDHPSTITYDYSSCIVTNHATGQKIKLQRTQAQAMEMLIAAEEHTVSKAEICQSIYNLDEKTATNSYNHLARRLRNSLSEIDGISLITRSGSRLQLIITEEFTAIWGG